MRLATPFSLLFLTGTIAAPAAAQRSPDAARQALSGWVGQEVRVTHGGATTAGCLWNTVGDSLFLTARRHCLGDEARPLDAVAVPLVAVDEVWQRKAAGGRGALWGAGIGVAIPLLAWAASPRCADYPPAQLPGENVSDYFRRVASAGECTDYGRVFLVAGALGGAGGALVGWAIGSAVRWREIYVAPGPRITVGPSRRGVAIALQFGLPDIRM